MTSLLPLDRTPPQGPLRRTLGQVMGQVIPVECNTLATHPAFKERSFSKFFNWPRQAIDSAETQTT